METINLEEILKKHSNICLDAMKEACRQTLELAAENFKEDFDNGATSLNDFKQSIIDTINQIK